MECTRMKRNSRKQTKNETTLDKFFKGFLRLGKLSYEFFAITLPLLVTPFVIVVIYVGYFIFIVVDKLSEIKK